MQINSPAHLLQVIALLIILFGFIPVAIKVTYEDFKGEVEGIVGKSDKSQSGA